MGEADWFAAICGVFVLGSGALMAALGERVMRMGGLGCIGVAVISLVVWFSYYRNAEAQSPIISNAPSINTFNQSGGTNTINIGPQRLLFDPAIGDELVSKLPPGKIVVLRSVGGNADQPVANQYHQYLVSKGFQVERMMIGMLAPPPDHKITIGNADADKAFVTIAPSAN